LIYSTPHPVKVQTIAAGSFILLKITAAYQAFQLQVYNTH